METTTVVETIAARRQHIQDNAKCVGCGATLADCKAERGKDPSAPPWFGCCARGVGLTPCQHDPDTRALLELLAEIESGDVRTVEETAPKERLPGTVQTDMQWFDYLNQGQKWQPNGKPMVAIADMDPEWRFNAARFLERRAKHIGGLYSLGQHIWFATVCASPLGPSESSADGITREIRHEDAEIGRDPVAWIRTTKLHKALTAGLPECSLQLTALAERARHWAACPARSGDGDCRCEELRANDKRSAERTPEWTIA